MEMNGLQRGCFYFALQNDVLSEMPYFDHNIECCVYEIYTNQSGNHRI